MKNQILIILFLSFLSPTHAQQFNFIQLIEMTRDRNTFEINMIKNLNQMFKKDNSITYNCETSEGDIIASANLPTNNPLYDRKFLFDDGIIYSESEIEEQELDITYEIRNKLVKQGKLLNKASSDSFCFTKGKIISLIKSETTKLGFAENYKISERVATTWYNWESVNYTILLSGSELFSPNYKKLTIQYNNDDFVNILKQITNTATYIKTEKEFGSFVSKYKYNNYLISTERLEDGNGGLIKIYWEK